MNIHIAVNRDMFNNIDIPVFFIYFASPIANIYLLHKKYIGRSYVVDIHCTISTPTTQTICPSM